MKERINKYAIALLSVIMVCLLVVPAMADDKLDRCPVETRPNGAINGTVFIDSVAWNEQTTLTLNTDVTDGTVKATSATTVSISVDKDGWVMDETPDINGDVYMPGYLPVEYCPGTSSCGDWGNTRSLIRFDLSSIPSGATIDSATVYMYNIDGDVYGTGIYNIHKLTGDWGESTVTWNNQPGYDLTPTDSKSISDGTWHDWDVTSDAQDFVGGTSNYGWLIKLEPESDPNWPGIWCRSSEDSNPDWHPYLEVMYTESAPLEFGDAPDPTHPSLLASDGSRHNITDTEFLGLQSTGDGKDFEPDANIIDADLLDDGLVTSILATENPAQTVDFEVTNMIADDTLLVNILLDLNGDGDWNDVVGTQSEHVVQNQAISLPGIAEGVFTSDSFSTVGATDGATWMRITLTRQPINADWDGTMASAGYAEPFGCGETEDWEVELVKIIPEVETATGSGTATFESTAGTIVDLTAVAESAMPDAGKPDLMYPHGFFSFNITGLANGQTVDVTVTLPADVPVGTQYWKYIDSVWVQIPIGSDDGDNVITIQLTDGGLGDADGLADGTIVDPGAPGVTNCIYLSPDNSVSTGSPVQVDVYTYISATDTASASQFDIEYDPSCIQDFPSFDDTGSDWVAGGAAVTCTNPSSGILRFTTFMGLNPPISGNAKVGTLTFTCNTSCCGSFLNFTNAKYTTPSGTLFPAVDSGTFLCNDPNDPIMEVTKQVWDESSSSWVDALGPLGSEWVGQDVTFKITVTSGCLDLSDIVVEDVMDSNLLYNNNANPTEDLSTAHTATWNIGSLSASTSTSIDFNATIDGYGTSVNTATATAGVTNLGGVEVSATDQASVTTMPPAGIDVSKTIWNGTAWVEEITDATIGDTYRFRCEMENSGSPGMDLTSIEVWDVISPGLEYTNSAMIMTPNGVWRSIEPPTSITTYDPVNGTTVSWTIDNFLQDPLMLQPGQTFVVEYDATVIDYGYNCNVQYASGYCAAASSDVEGSNTACIYTPEPDMTVTDITVNYDASGVKNLAIGPQSPGTKTQSNNIAADITELNGIDVIFPFDVTFEIAGTPVCTVTVPSLAAGATTTVYCDNQFFPIAGDTYTITVTADSGVAIPETNEGNNSMSETLTAIVNGYTGDGWQDGRGISALQYHEGTVNLVYSTGDSAMYSAYYDGPWTSYTANWTPSNFNIPATDSCIKKARLYVYYNYDKEPDGNPTDTGDGYYFNMTFNGVEKEVDQHYSDRKSFGSYDYTYGMIAYDVADLFMVTSDNHAELTYTWPTGNFKDNSMTGMLLVVVYNNTETEPERIIWINEGYDSLYARDYYGVSSEEATTYAEFVGYGSIPMDEVVGANLVTVAPHADEGGEKNKLSFNDGEWYGVWNSYTGATELGINEKDVRTYLKATDNTASFQSHKSGIHKSQPYPYKPDRGDSMEASNAFLIVQKGRAVIEVVDPEECIGVTEQFDVPININPMGASVYGVEYELSFDPAVIHAEWQNEGDFLKQGVANTNVYINTIDNDAGTVTFAVTRKDTLTGATEPGTLATVHFTAVQMGANTTLILTSVKASDPEALPINMERNDSIVYVCDNVEPVAVPECLFKYNNVGTKYMSTTYFDGSESSDDPDGSITNYRWYFGDGNYGAGMTYDHIYGSWNWNGASYDPFEVILTVEDDGTPMMDNSTKIYVNVYIAGDANGDGEVDIFDATIVGLEWGQDCIASGSWGTDDRKDKADLNNDCEVDIFDAVIIGANWGHTA